MFTENQRKQAFFVFFAMCDGFNHGALQTAVAQICQSMGWDALQKSTHDLLTDVLQKYLEEIAKSAHGYSQLYCRTEPNLDDLNLAFQDIGVCLHELEDFVSQVDQVPFIHQLPQYPKPKPCVLHHPRNGEIAERLEQYYDYLPPLVSKLLQNEDEKKAAAEDADTVNSGEDQGSAEGFVRNEIKTVGEETSSQHVAVKRPHNTPPGLESEIKKRRVDLPFMQKGNRGNEMDILDALQGNLSSPSPTPSPDVWSTAKTFEIPPTSAVSPVIATSSKESATSTKSTAKPKAEEKKAVKADKQPGKQPTGKAKASPKKKVKTPKTPSPVKKSSSLTTSMSPKVPKEKLPSPMKSPVKNAKESPAIETEAKAKTPTKKIKTTPKKEKNSGNKTKKPVAKSPLTKTVPVAAKENIKVKESMPKLIIKPIKKEVNDDQQFTVSELLPPDHPDKQEKTQPQKSKRKAVPSKKPKVKKEKEILEPSLKVEPKEWSTPSTSEGLKFSMAEFAMASVDSNVPADLLTDPALEHKKKKKKRKEKDKDRERKKDKSKKLKTDHTEPLQAFSTPPIPRITVKLDSTSQPALLTNKEMIKTETSQIEHGTDATERLNPTVASSQMVDNVAATTSKVSIKQEPGVVANAATTVPKLTIKSESLERTVVAQTLSTTFVHGYSKVYYCPVCGDPDDGSFMIGCDGCDEWFHGTCVGIIDDPGEVDWFCSSCHAKRDKDSKDKQKKKKKKKSKEKTK